LLHSSALRMRTHDSAAVRLRTTASGTESGGGLCSRATSRL
jgi:hypothetical protein